MPLHMIKLIAFKYFISEHVFFQLLYDTCSFPKFFFTKHYISVVPKQPPLKLKSDFGFSYGTRMVHRWYAIGRRWVWRLRLSSTFEGPMNCNLTVLKKVPTNFTERSNNLCIARASSCTLGIAGAYF